MTTPRAVQIMEEALACCEPLAAASEFETAADFAVEHLAERCAAAEARCERYRVALEKIADYEIEWHRSLASNVHSLQIIARAALAEG